MFKQKREVFEAAAKKSPEGVRPYLVKASPFLAVAATILQLTLPLLEKMWQLGCWVYSMLEPYHPEDLAYIFGGLFMVFFGGEYPAVITAAEAYRQIGFEPTYKALGQLYSDYKKVQAASAKDDKVDKDGDGIPDVQQINSTQLIERKASLMLKTTDPQVVGDAVAAISSGWLAVLAALKISFARAVTLGAAIGDTLSKPSVKILGPPLKKIVPEDYHRWIIPGINYTCKFIAISIAWTIQRVISAFHSCIRGGHMAAAGFINYLHRYHFIKSTANDTYVDEIVGYVLAALGFASQVGAGFRVPFPLNILFFPLTCVEYYLVWNIMS